MVVYVIPYMGFDIILWVLFIGLIFIREKL